MKRLMLVFYYFLSLLSGLNSCDLNHDWELISQDKRLEIKNYVLYQMLKDALKESGFRYMLSSVRDLYRQDGQTNALEETFMSFASEIGQNTNNSGNSQLLFLPRKIAQADLYDPAVLAKLSDEFSLDGFLRVKLTRYNLIEQNFVDRYERNEGLRKQVIYHDVELAYALIDKNGQYKDFKDLKNRLEESLIFEDSNPEKKVFLAFKGWDTKLQIWKDETYFLGLDSLDNIGVFLWNISGF